MRTHTFVGRVCFASLLALSSLVHGEIIIDDFSTPFANPSELGTTSGVFQQFQQQPAGAIGDRNARFFVTPVNGLGGNLSILPSQNKLVVSNDATVQDYAFAIEYSVTDLDLSGQNQFTFELEGDLDDRQVPAVARFGINVTSGGQTESRGINVSADGRYSIPFSLYTNTDFSDVDGIEIASNNDQNMFLGADYTIGTVSAVPEPSSGAMLMTFLGMGLTGLRMRKA